MDGVVVIGYGSVKKNDMTGSVVATSPTTSPYGYSSFSKEENLVRFSSWHTLILNNLV